MKPIIILPPDAMSAEDIQALRDNDLCVVVSADPSKVKFVDPIPAASSRSHIEHAAIRLSRMLLTKTWGSYTQSGTIDHGDISRMFCGLLVKGTPLDAGYESPEEEADRAYRNAKCEEASRLAREEAKAEHAAKKAAKLKA